MSGGRSGFQEKCLDIGGGVVGKREETAYSRCDCH